MTKIAEARLQKAMEYLEEAEIIHWERIGNLPVLTNLYHVMMNCLFALFDLNEPGSILHVDIIQRFKHDYVQTGIFDKRFADAMDFAFHITHECNCEHMKPPSDEEIDRLFPVVREFVFEISEYLDKVYGHCSGHS